MYIYAEFTAEKWNIEERISKGILSSALPIQEPEGLSYVELPEDPYIVTNTFNAGGKGKSPFGTAGCIDNFASLHAIWSKIIGESAERSGT